VTSPSLFTVPARSRLRAKMREFQAAHRSIGRVRHARMRVQSVSNELAAERVTSFISRRTRRQFVINALAPAR